MPQHRITIDAEDRGGGRYTYSYLCSCGAKNYGCRSKAAAEHEGRQHQAEEAGYTADQLRKA